MDRGRPIRRARLVFFRQMPTHLLRMHPWEGVPVHGMLHKGIEAAEHEAEVIEVLTEDPQLTDFLDPEYYVISTINPEKYWPEENDVIIIPARGWVMLYPVLRCGVEVLAHRIARALGFNPPCLA